MRQASRRSWRIGQKEPVRVYYMTYEDCLQTDALKLIAKKTTASLTVEGDLPEDGLSSYGGVSDSVYIALAKQLAGHLPPARRRPPNHLQTNQNPRTRRRHRTRPPRTPGRQLHHPMAARYSPATHRPAHRSRRLPAPIRPNLRQGTQRQAGPTVHVRYGRLPQRLTRNCANSFPTRTTPACSTRTIRLASRRPAVSSTPAAGIPSPHLLSHA